MFNGMRKLGSFEIEGRILRNADAKLLLKALSGKVIILESEQSFVECKIRYKAYCEDFKEVLEGDMLPLYRMEIKPVFKVDKSTNREKIVKYKIKFIKK